MFTVRNFNDMDRAIESHSDFEHRSYSGRRTDLGYELWHHSTLIAIINYRGEFVYGDMAYYSQTTSGFQGRILRLALSDEGRNTVRALFVEDKPELARLNRMMRAA